MIYKNGDQVVRERRGLTYINGLCIGLDMAEITIPEEDEIHHGEEK